MSEFAVTSPDAAVPPSPSLSPDPSTSSAEGNVNTDTNIDNPSQVLVANSAPPSPSAPTPPSLIPDLLPRIAQLIQADPAGPDYALLARCARVSWAFHRAAAAVLYARVVLAPRAARETSRGAARGGAVLDLRDRDRGGGIPKTSNFESACLPRYALYVVALEIRGYLSALPPPRNVLPAKLAAALPRFVNLARVRLTPRTYPAALFAECVPVLRGVERLGTLCMDAAWLGGGVGGSGSLGLGLGRAGIGLGRVGEGGSAEALVEIGVGGQGRSRLRVLALVSPGRRMLQLLPDWLGRLSGSLTELHLMDNCGSVTPGVLKSFLPHVAGTLQGLTLGLSYSLTNQDVFDFVSELCVLERLHLRYYWQVRRPAYLPTLPALRAFTASYSGTHTRVEVDRLDKWVRWVVGESRQLEELRLKSDLDIAEPGEDRNEEDEDEDGGGSRLHASISHDALVDHVSSRHAARLKVLDLRERGTCVRKRKMVRLLEACVGVEELSLRVSESALMHFARHPFELRNLQYASFRICNARRAWRRTQAENHDALATEIMRKYYPSLRRLSINGIHWEASYITDLSEGNLVVAKRVEVLVPPWDRKSRD